MINVQEMMQQAQAVQFKMQELQEKLRDVAVEGQSGGSLVKVQMTCDGTVRAINIDPSLIKAEEKDTLEDLIVAAINNAADAKDQKIADETRAMMEELGLPADMELPF